MSLISVVIPARNAAGVIGEQLNALSRQTFLGNWEVVVADNGSTDGTAQRVREWRDRLPELRVIDASAHRGTWHGRNVGAQAAAGAFLLYSDADDVVSEAWVEAMANALEDHPFVTGPIDLTVLNPPERMTWGTGWPAPLRNHGFLPYAMGCNLGVRRSIFDVVGGFRPDFLRCGDVDFSWRAQLAGHPLHFEDRALIHRRLRLHRDLWSIRLQAGEYHALLYRCFRAHGMARSSLGEAVRTYAHLVKLLPLLGDPAARYRWLDLAGTRLGRLVGSVRHRVFFP